MTDIIPVKRSISGHIERSFADAQDDKKRFLDDNIGEG